MPNTFVSCAAESGTAGAFSFRALYQAYLDCRKRKRGSRDAQRFDMALLDSLVETGQALRNRTWAPGRSVCFVTTRPKAREIHAAAFADRVVHHLLVHEDPARLVGWRDDVAAFLAARLGLVLKHQGVLRPATDGADFLGYIVRPGYRLVRRRVLGSLHERLGRLERRLVRGGDGGVALDLRAADREALRATLASYLGHFRHASSHRLVDTLWLRHPWLGEVLDRLPGHRLRPLWEPPAVTSLHGQWRYFRRARPGNLVLVQVGKEVELYGADTVELDALPSVHAARGQRAGLGETRRLPLGRLAGLRRRLRRLGRAHCFVGEEGYLKGGMKRRVLRLAWRPRGIPEGRGRVGAGPGPRAGRGASGDGP